MRTVFFGTPEMAVPVLEAVAGAHRVAGVVCQPDKPKGRGKRLVAPPVKQWAEARGIETHQPVKLNDGAFEAWLRARAPEVCVLVAYGRILKAPILAVPPHGFINVHPSLLPKYRGPAPVSAAICAGDAETGVTIMRLDEGMDTGAVLLQEALPIGPDDTTPALTAKLMARGAALVVEALDRIAAGTAQFTPQDDARATVTRIIEKDDGRIDWTQPAQSIHNQVRAMLPWPVAHCRFEGQVCRLHRTEVVHNPKPGAVPGEVVAVDKDRVVVAAGKDALAILEFQAPGKRAMPMGDYLRGRPIEPGARFESLAD